MTVTRRTLGQFVPDLKSRPLEALQEAFLKLGIEVSRAWQTPRADLLVVAEIMDVKRHPNADTLNVCKVNAGTHGFRTVVCGAANVRAKLKVVLALEGARMKDGTVIARREIRGVASEGMICALDELTGPEFVSDFDRRSIIELDAKTPLSVENVNDLLWLDDDHFELELTANRPDLNGIYPLAVELAGVLGLAVVALPNPPRRAPFKVLAKDRSFPFEAPRALAPVFATLSVAKVAVEESSVRLKNVLRACGVKPVNNAVDVSNLAMLYSGTPSHPYDASKLAKRLIVRLARPGERILALNGKEYPLLASDIVVADRQKVVCLAGIVGGESTKVDAGTERVVYEIARFDHLRVKATAERTLPTEASFRGAKQMAAYAAFMNYVWTLKLLAEFIPGAVPLAPRGVKRKGGSRWVRAKIARINALVGKRLTRKEMRGALKALGFKAVFLADVFWAKAPKWRRDVNIWQDLSEEVVRAYGVANIPAAAPVGPVRFAATDDNAVTRALRENLLAHRLQEVKTYNLTSRQINAIFDAKTIRPLRVANPLSSQREFTRVSLVGQLLDVYRDNVARKVSDVLIFETQRLQGEDSASDRVAGLLRGTILPGAAANSGVASDFYVAKGIVKAAAALLGMKLAFNASHDFTFVHPNKSAAIVFDGATIGVIGEIHPHLLRDDGRPPVVFEFDYTDRQTAAPVYAEASPFPSARRDVSFLLPDTALLDEIVWQCERLANVVDVAVFDVYAPGGGKTASFALSLTIQAPDRTLTGEAIQAVVDLAAKIVADRGGTVR